jgi:ribosomal protein S18 acetylase RimI-like enzyme
MIRSMRDSEIGDVSELLGESYVWLGERERLSSKQVEFLVSKRGSTEIIQRESRTQQYLVTDDQTRLTGMVSVSDDTITKLYVRPSMSGPGIGRALYEAAEASIAASGHVRVALVAFSSAVPFYERMGLRAVGRKEATGAMAGVVVTLMEKHLVPA